MESKINPHDFIGQKFSRLTITKALEPLVIRDGKGNIKETRNVILADCDCGTKDYKCLLNSLRFKNTQSCGCLNRESASMRTIKRNTVHGMYGIPEYGVWIVLKDRCLNPRNKGYKNYGGRGITVCDSWIDSFESFISDMGRRPSGRYTIERIDNDKGYSKDNCKWATYKEQARNTRRSRYVHYNGKKITLAELSEETGFSHQNISLRLNKGLNANQAIDDLKTLSWKK